MISVESIFETILVMQNPQGANFSLIKLGFPEKDIYYGKDMDGNFIFSAASQNTQLRPSLQKTKKLIFWFNASCRFTVNNAYTEKIMNVLTCTSSDKDELIAFIRLTLAFIHDTEDTSPKRMYELFTLLTNLFASANKASLVELQGFYGELYAIKYFNQMGVNLSDFWQKREKMKFDFSVSSQKKIEVKSTTKDTRVHHFKHEQLLSDLYDICVISIMLRADDKGNSLFDLVQDVRVIASNNFETLIYIEDFIKSFDHVELDNIRFDSTYTDRHLHVYKAENVPRFEENQPRGVSKTEYDSDLSNSSILKNNLFIDWVRNEENRSF